MKQKALSGWLKAAVIGLGIVGLFVYAFIIPSYGGSLRAQYPEFANCYWPWVIFLWGSGVPCYAALVFGWKIFGNIGRDRSFCAENAKYMQAISLLAAGDTVYFFLGNVILLLLNMSHPGVTLFSMAVVAIGTAVFIAAAALSHLIRKAAVLQEQSDLTV